MWFSIADHNWDGYQSPPPFAEDKFDASRLRNPVINIDEDHNYPSRLPSPVININEAVRLDHNYADLEFNNEEDDNKGNPLTKPILFPTVSKA